MDQHSQEPTPPKCRRKYETFRALEIGEAKWCKKHIQHKGNDFLDEGISLLDDMKLWWEKQNHLWACHNSKKKDRMNIDGTFLPHRKREILTNLYK
jgi:hypothetical protein